jgi:leucyl/phenylalanyl-tRNA--protein transferase
VPLLTYLEPGDPFPPSSEALDEPNGLLAAGGCLDSATRCCAPIAGAFSLVRGAAADALVDAGSALGPLSRGTARVALPARTLRREWLRLTVNRASKRSCAPARPRARASAAPGSMTAMLEAYGGCTRGLGPLRSRSGDGDGSSAGCTASAAGRRLLRREHVLARPDASKVALVALARALRFPPWRAHRLPGRERAPEQSRGTQPVPDWTLSSDLRKLSQRGPSLAVPASCEELA